MWWVTLIEKVDKKAPIPPLISAHNPALAIRVVQISVIDLRAPSDAATVLFGHHCVQRYLDWVIIQPTTSLPRKDKTNIDDNVNLYVFTCCDFLECNKTS